MFGVLKSASCTMEPGQRQQWMGHVCGVCLGLKHHHGHACRTATNYDAALLSVLCDAQTPQPQTQRTSYCPLRNSFKMTVPAAANPGVRYAASMALMMASTKIQDHVHDAETGWRHIRWVAAGISDRWMRAAQKATGAFGFDADIITNQIRRQAEVEAQPGQDFFSYARPTEIAVGAAFGHTAVIANRPQNADILREMGRMFGRIMVLLDSYRDYEADLESGRFNALAASFSGDEWQQQAVRIFRQAYHKLNECLDQLDLIQPDLLHTLLAQQLKQKGYKTLQACRGLSCNCHASNTEVPLESNHSLAQRHKRRPRKPSPWWHCCDCLSDPASCDCCCECCSCCSYCDSCDGDSCDCCDCGNCDADGCDCCDVCGSCDADCCDCCEVCGDCDGGCCDCCEACGSCCD
ncbi:MAG: hypothetical protein GY832_04185 [Chloroflexi bacterium]|nr:hypothetical protein [Chloroflexota bacterium]